MVYGTDDLGLIRLDPDECWGFLERHDLGRVALVHLDGPDVFPVQYAVDGRAVVFRTARGTKLTGATRRAKAAFEVDEVSALFETGTSVVLHGTLEEVVDTGDLDRLRRLPLRPWAPGERDHFVRILPERISGRRIAAHQPDDGLAADAG